MPVTAMPLLIGFCVKAAVVLAAAWLVTLAMRRATAATRHLVWTCAIAGAALMPLVVLAGPTWQMSVPPAVRGTMTDFIQLDDASVTGAGSTAALGPAQAVPTGRKYSALALGIWVAGSVGILGYLLLGTVALRRIRRTALSVDAAWVQDAHALARTLGIHRQLEFVESTSTTTPLVCGFWRPLVVLPLTADRWSAQCIRAVLLHELAHVKRRDCLTQLLAQLLCAAYWFNPMVWIATRRLREERERACDDFVLSAGMRGSDYARHLVDIARAVRPPVLSPLAAAGLPMAHRSQLENRLLAILDPAMRRSPAFYARVAAIAAVLAIAVPVAALQPRDTAAQVATTTPSFEVASVRANVGSDRSITFFPNPPDGITLTNRPLESIITYAYEVQPFRVLGLPGWAQEERFDITAKAAAPISDADRRLMTRSLLVDRFRLKAHFEPREQTVYVLTRLRTDGTLGPGLKPRPECVKAGDCQSGGTGSRFAARVTSSAVTLDQLASGMLSLMTENVVRNETGVDGMFDVALSWRPDSPGVTGDPADARPSFFTAIEEQLGLKLTAQRRPVDVLVIESIDRPTRD